MTDQPTCDTCGKTSDPDGYCVAVSDVRRRDDRTCPDDSDTALSFMEACDAIGSSYASKTIEGVRARSGARYDIDITVQRRG